MLQRQSLAVVVWITHLAGVLLVDLQRFIYEKVTAKGSSRNQN